MAFCTERPWQRPMCLFKSHSGFNMGGGRKKCISGEQVGEPEAVQLELEEWPFESEEERFGGLVII